MKFYVGVKKPIWLARLEVPAMVSISVLRGRTPVTNPTVPAVVIDSGAYVELHRHGYWRDGPEVYARRVEERVEALPLDWIAPQDWPCEPGALIASGRTVAYHQAATIESVVALRELTTLPVLPVLQGWSITEYLHHLDAYDAAGIDLRTEPVVGVGSTCRRHVDVSPELRLIAAAVGPRLHAFGVKGTTLRKAAGVLASSDSAAWSIAARREGIRLPGCEHTDCRNCHRWAEAWARKRMETAA